MTKQAEAAKAKFMEVVDAIDWEFVSWASKSMACEVLDLDTTHETVEEIATDIYSNAIFFQIKGNKEAIEHLPKFVELAKEAINDAN